MQPWAIAFKNYKINPFTNRGSGELMVIHQCLNCGKLSPNRIAGDDNVYQIIKILKESLNLEGVMANRLRNLGLNIITKDNKEEALIFLLGINYQKFIKNLV